MRLFTAIDLEDTVRENLSRLVERLRATARVKWSAAGNLHVTTKFIGEWPPERLEELASVLRDLPPAPPIRIAVQGLGWFPNPRAPRVFWAGVKADPALAELARATDAALARIGVAAETRPYSPHLTLARIKEPVPLDGLREATTALESEAFGEFVAGRFSLYLSELASSASLYKKLGSFPLDKS